MSNFLKDFQIRKSIHINMTKDTHAALRIKLFEKKLSMQEVFESLAVKIVEGDSYMQNFLTICQKMKQEKNINKFTPTDAESIYEVIANLDSALPNEEG